jgi:hypothetical protein
MVSGGGGWIRTNVGARQRIYSPPPLATRAPLPGREAGTRAKSPPMSTRASRPPGGSLHLTAATVQSALSGAGNAPGPVPQPTP